MSGRLLPEDRVSLRDFCWISSSRRSLSSNCSRLLSYGEDREAGWDENTEEEAAPAAVAVTEART